jgi:DNA-binding LytR/AlgR family response regulator
MSMISPAYSAVIVFFILGTFNSYLEEQQWLEYLYEYNIERLENKMPQGGSFLLYELIFKEIQYLKTGTIDSARIEKIREEENPLAIILYVIQQNRTAKTYRKELHQLLLQQLNRFQKTSDVFWENQFHLATISYIILFSPAEKHLYPLLEDHLEAVKVQRLNEVDRFRLLSLKIDLESQRLYYKVDSSSQKKLDKLIDEYSKINPKSSFLKGLKEKTIGIYHEVFTKQPKKAIKHFDQASFFFKQIPFWFGKQSFVLNEHSKAILLSNTDRYAEALPIFKKGLQEKAIKAHPEGLVNTHEYLSKCYEGLGDSKKALFHFKMARKHLDSLNRMEQTKQIVKMELTNDVEKKQEQLEELAKKHMSLNTQFQTLIPIAGGLLLMVLVFIWLYKRTKSKKTILEHEKESTLKEVEKLKHLVIKNHIILKDKTKVYINDLMYIKADDKYIRVFTSDEKNHLVRGRISDLDEQLPPNFIRTHRSYITNRNFIKQIQPTLLVLTEGTKIPISRKFRDQMP